MTELLFCYGTLQQPEVQRATFGREVPGHRDAIVGYDLDYVTITDPRVVATSGSDRHPILRPTEQADAHVDGMVFAISDTELAAADAYEVDDYRRISVPLRSGATAWVYVFAGLADYQGRVEHVTPVVAFCVTTTWPSTAISQCSSAGPEPQFGQ